MLDAERIPLPPGLPAHLSVGKEGYDTLCALLDVATRGRRQVLASATFVKQFLKAAGNAPARQARTAERTRQSLLALYSDPDARRRIWRNVRHHESTDKAGGTPLPSLEHAALSRYDAGPSKSREPFFVLHDIPDIFQESAFHAQYGRTKAGSRRRGPLTYEQETLARRRPCLGNP